VYLYPTPFLNLALHGRQVVSVIPWPLYPQGNRSWYKQNRRIGGPESVWSILEKGKKSLALVGI